MTTQLHHGLQHTQDAAKRRETAYERLGTRTPRCTICGETNPAALTGTAPGIRCYECRAAAGGKRTTEAHHLAGQHNSPFTVAIPANDHRVLSDRQRDWSQRTLRNPDGSPLLAIAATLRGWLDLLHLIIERTLAAIPAALETLDAALCVALGANWWLQVGWQGVTP